MHCKRSQFGGGTGQPDDPYRIATARALGRYDHVNSLASQALVASWPLPNGTLLIPRLLSNFTKAPYLGEACTLFAFVHRPQTTFPGTPTTGLPRSVYLGLAVYVLIGFMVTGRASHGSQTLAQQRPSASRLFPSRAG